MEVPAPTCPASPARDQPAPAPGPLGVPARQASPHLTLGPIILPPEQSLAPTVFLKALPIPLYHTVPPGGLQPRAPLVTGGVDGAGVPFILSPLLQPEGPGPAQVGKPATPTLTVNIVGTLPVLSPGPGPALGGLGKARKAGKYLCPHCGRDCLKPSVLEKHLRSHTGERPFPCATCGIAFKTQSNLYKHRRTQTHLSNARLSVECEGAGGSLPEEVDKAAETSRAAGQWDGRSRGGGDGAESERPLSPGTQGTGHRLMPPRPLSPIAKNPDLKSEATSCPGPPVVDREAPLDSPHTAPAGPPLARRRLPEQKSPSGGRASSSSSSSSSSEKPWDARASEGRLRKCESSDSGYLSRSDSAEQPPGPCSPLHSLWEHSTQAEAQEGAPRPGGARARPGGQGPSLELEKRQLEERIARLISHNQAVVDDPQLDHVRPRKTGLAKQGSIDLPLPYTYKDSFHFEVRALEPGRPPRAPGPTRPAGPAPDRARPLFFHSVPTQLSTAGECVPVTRSNSLPFVEGTRPWQELLGPRPARARLADFPSGHPRALVRQAAVEDLRCAPTGDSEALADDRGRKRALAGEGPAGRGKAAGRRPGPRKPKMFSQERWQVYGHETFRRIYQKGAGSPAGRRAKEASSGPGTGEAAGGQGAAPTQDRGSSASGATCVGPTPGPRGSPAALGGLGATEGPAQREPVAHTGGGDQPRACGDTSPPAFNGQRLELGCLLPLAPGTLKAGGREALELEGGTRRGEETQEPQQPTLQAPRLPSRGSGETQPAGATLPSERKKLRVEEPSCLGQLGSPGGGSQTPGGPVQGNAPPSSNQDSDSGHKPGGLPGSAGRAETSGMASAASGALLPVGARTEGPALGAASGVPGGPSQLAIQPQVPGIPATLAATTFPPKYLLRLPRGETLQPPPGAQGPGRSQEPLGGSGEAPEPASAGPGLGASLLPCPATSQPSGRADDFGEDPSCSGPGEEEGGLDISPPAAGEPPGSSAGTLSTPPGDSRSSETRDTGRLCAGSTWARARPSGSVLHLWALDRDGAGPCENAPEEPLVGPLVGHSRCCSLRPSSVLSVLPPPGWPEPASGTNSGPQGAFPSLRAEPRLTWCCLSHSGPLPAEQEKAASGYWALHGPGSCALDQGAQARALSKAVSGRWSETSLARGGEPQPWKLCYPAAPGMAAGHPGSEPGGKQGLPWRREKRPRGSSKRRALRRHRGSCLQRRAQRRASRLRLRKLRGQRRDCAPPPPEGVGPRGTLGQASSGMAGLSLPGESPGATSAASLGCGDREKEEEEDRGPTSGGSSSGTSPGPARERGSWTAKDSIPSAELCGDGCPQGTAAGPGSALPHDSRVRVADHGLDPGPPETHSPPSQERFPADLRPRAFSNAHEPLSFESEGSSPGQGATTSLAATGMSLGAGGGQATPGAPSAEPQDHGPAAGETGTQRSPDSNAAQGTSPPLSPEPSAGQRLSGSAPARPPEQHPPDTPASGPGSTSSSWEEGGPQALLPPKGQPGGGAMLAPGPPVGKDGEEIPGSGSIAPKDGLAPSGPGQPTDAQEAPSRAMKKRSLGGMRKQTRVELSDTSSDDEGRLVIEI